MLELVKRLQRQRRLSDVGSNTNYEVVALEIVVGGTHGHHAVDAQGL